MDRVGGTVRSTDDGGPSVLFDFFVVDGSDVL